MSEEAASDECPVCYEKVSSQNQSLRTLTCNHVFCHDCLVKTVINQQSQPKKVVCPVCRHVTFLNRRSVGWAAKNKKGKQTLEIPSEPRSPAPGSGRPLPPSQRLRRVFGCCARTLSSAGRPERGASQIFVISGRGRPMSEEELRAPAAGEAAAPEPRRCRMRWLMVLLSFIIVGVVIAAILPWITSFQ